MDKDQKIKAISSEAFGSLPDGSKATLYTLVNNQGSRLQISDYGCTVVRMESPDKRGELADVVLGFDSLQGYLESRYFFGAIIGRTANRIGGASFSLDGVTHTLAKNTGIGNNLHGGLKGFDKVLWSVTELTSPEGPALSFKYHSADGEEGFPGAVDVEAVHTWTHDHTLRIDLTATSGRPTVLNLTHHSYFNLAGAGQGDILSHQVEIFADHFTPIGQGQIPTGEIRELGASPLDFRTPHAIGERIKAVDGQIELSRGYDHNFVLRKSGDPSIPQLAARVREENTGRVLEVSSTQPGVQFYTGNFIRPDTKGKDSQVYGPHSAFCLEPQHFPDSPNKPQFPSTRLDPGQTYRHTIAYRLSAS
ncbi:MAG: aldose epimerase family protein [candidate division FCPU426 bacterium]